MNLAIRPLLIPLRANYAFRIVIALAILVWFISIAAIPWTSKAQGTITTAWLIIAITIVYRVTKANLDALRSAGRVLTQLQTPRALWRQLTRAAFLQIALAWLFTSAIACVGPVLGKPGGGIAAGPAILSLVACLAILPFLLPGVGLKSALRWLVPAAALVLLANGINAQLARFGNLPTAIHILCTLSFPALALKLADAWSAGPPPRFLSGEAAQARTRLTAYLRRYRRVTWDFFDMAKSGWPAEWRGGVHASQVFVHAITMLAFFPLLMQFDSQLSLNRLFGIGMVGGWMSSALIARDVHWRSFLMPGGLRRGQLANTVFFPTWVMAIMALMVVALGYIAYARLGALKPWEMIGRTLIDFSPMMFEVTLAVSLGVLLRGMPKGAWVSGLLIAPAMVLPLVAKNIWPITIPLALYAVLLLVASVIVLMAANRVWTPEKLFRSPSL